MLRILTYMASRTRIDMSAEGSGPAALGGAQRSDLPRGQPASVAVDESLSCGADYPCHRSGLGH